jgi:acetyltransferase-like isoleucine patch superfamily enzyme
MKRSALDPLRRAARAALDRAALLRMRAEVRPREFAAFGRDSVLEPPVRLINRHRIAIGDGVHVRPNAWLSATAGEAPDGEPCITIGDGAELGADLVIASQMRVTIGPDVLAADRVFIGDNHHEYRDPTRPVSLQGQAEARPVEIGAGAFLGIGACVLRGVTVGANAVVGAGAVVTADVPTRCVAAGNPARIVKHWDAGADAWVEGPPTARVDR